MSDKYSLTGRVFHKIREDILDGHYKQQEELRETAIGQELGVSRTPVREALRQLELEGLVTIVPNRGTYVTGITVEDVYDIYMIRARLEGLCASMAAERITKEQIGQMEEVIVLSEFHEKQQNFEQLFTLDGKFHEILYEACGSKILEHLLKDFHHYVQRARKTSLSESTRAEKSTKEHEDILDAIRLKNPQKADELSTLHILNTVKNLRNNRIKIILKKQEEENGQN